MLLGFLTALSFHNYFEKVEKSQFILELGSVRAREKRLLEKIFFEDFEGCKVDELNFSNLMVFSCTKQVQKIRHDTFSQLPVLCDMLDQHLFDLALSLLDYLQWCRLKAILQLRSRLRNCCRHDELFLRVSHPRRRALIIRSKGKGLSVTR